LSKVFEDLGLLWKVVEIPKSEFAVDLGALLAKCRRKKKLTQETVAEDVFGSATRKGDIARLEGGRIAKPQPNTVQRLAEYYKIEAEVDALYDARSQRVLASIRAKKETLGKAIETPSGLGRDELEELAKLFEISDLDALSDSDLTRLLTAKAEEYRALKRDIAAISEKTQNLHNMKAAASDAAERLDFAEVELLLKLVHATELEEAAQTAQLRASNALMRGRADHAYTLLSAAADSFAAINPLAPARMRLNFEDILYAHGLRYGGDGLHLAAQMNQTAIAGLDETTHPDLYARAQNNLAIALQEQGSRTDGAKGAALLAQSVTAYQNALRVRTEADHPVQWAMTQNNLATALQEQGSRTDGAKGAALLAQSVTAYQNALRVYTEADHPVQWATTQNNLAAALQEQGIRTDGAKGTALLAQSVTAYQNALRVRTEADHPVQWATTQNNLANALANQGIRTDGPKGAALLAQAVTAYHNALRIRTEDHHPVQWAETQGNLAILHLQRSKHSSCADPRAALQTALTHVDNALRIFDPVHMPYDHGTATTLRAEILAALSA
jgi:transcriptional regulator with XRE-family HTH domain